MTMRKINCYGTEAEAERFDFRETKKPDESKFVGGATYDRYGTADPCAIHRIAVGADGLVCERWAFGNWAEAESLAYERTIDETMEVEP